MIEQFALKLMAFLSIVNRVALARFPTAAFVASPSLLKRGVSPVPIRSWSWLLAETNNNNGKAQDFKPTWTYVPYDPAKANQQNQNRRRSFSTWKVPKKVTIPEEKLEMSFVRSSGSGGQNVNKLSTKVEIRFDVNNADWIPGEVRDRLKTQQSNRISKDGILTLTSQEYRT